MNKEELIGKLQMVYVGDRNTLNELVGYYDGLKQGIEQLQQELNQKNKIIEEIKEDIDFVRKSVCQELYMSEDKRTRKEMDTCYHILTEALEKGSEE